MKKSKLEKINEEKKALRKSIEKAGAGVRKKSGGVTVPSLRKMDDVVKRSIDLWIRT